MKTTALLIFLASHQGYWLSGQQQTIAVEWIAKAPMPPSDLIWELGFGPTRLMSGTVAMNGDQPGQAEINAPAVRVRATLRWTYRLVQRDGNKSLDSGELLLYDFPADLKEDWPRRLESQSGKSTLTRSKLLVWADTGGLPKVLQEAKVPFTQVANLANVFDRPDMILIAADSLDDSAFPRAPLVDLARAGASVAIFEQTRPRRLIGYDLARRQLPAAIHFKGDHPLFDRLTPEDLGSWVAGDKGELWAVRLPTNEAALELAWWPREAPSRQPSPMDALIATRTIGAGRIVLFQAPLGPWGQDPRSQILLGNLLSYLATRPEPTPAPSDRHEARRPSHEPVPAIPLGANP